MVKNRPLSFIFCKDSSDLAKGTQRGLFYIWNVLSLLLSSAGICVLCLLLGIGMMDVQFFFDYFRNPLLFLLNYLPIMMVQLLIYCVSGRQWISFLTTALVFVCASAGDFYKLKFRSEPFVFSDISSIGTALGVAGNYDMSLNIRIILSITCVVLGTLLLLFFTRGKFQARSRLICALLVLSSIYPLWRFVYSSDDVYESPAASSEHVIPGWLQQFQVSKGFIYQFIYSIGDSLQQAPSGYNEEQAAAVYSSFSDSDIPNDLKVNLLVFQLEAFCDLNTLDIDGISDKAYSDLYKLKDESISGRLIANVFAGGTMNTERCFLTGSSQLYDYRRDSNSYVHYLAQQGYATIGSHPNYQAFYNRINVNNYLGFQDYWFLENYYAGLLSDLPDQWLSDNILFPQVTDQFIQYIHSGTPVFSFNVTMQGHGPYDTDHYVFDGSFWQRGSCSDAASFVINNYLGSVSETAALLLSTADKLRDISEPVVLLAYGDHKPWLGDNDAIYKELEINLDSSSEEGFYNKYSTGYLIWANDAAKALLDNDFVGEGPDLSPGYLMTVLFNQLGWDGSAYMKLSRQFYETVPVINSNGYYIENGCFTSSLSSKSENALRELEWVQYYLNR